MPITDSEKERFLYLKKQQAIELFKRQNQDRTRTISLFSNLWFYSLLLIFLGVGLYGANISIVIGTFLLLTFSPTSLVSIILAIVAQRSFTKDQNEFFNKEMEFAKAILNQINSDKQSSGGK